MCIRDSTYKDTPLITTLLEINKSLNVFSLYICITYNDTRIAGYNDSPLITTVFRCILPRFGPFITTLSVNSKRKLDEIEQFCRLCVACLVGAAARRRRGGKGGVASEVRFPPLPSAGICTSSKNCRKMSWIYVIELKLSSWLLAPGGRQPSWIIFHGAKLKLADLYFLTHLIF